MSQCQSLQCQKYINCLGLIENQNLIKELKLLTNIQSSFFTNYLDKAGLKYNYRNNIANMMFSLSICQWWELYGPLGSLHWPMVTADESVRWQECVIHWSRTWEHRGLFSLSIRVAPLVSTLLQLRDGMLMQIIQVNIMSLLGALIAPTNTAHILYITQSQCE